MGGSAVLPSPTAEMLLILGAFREYAGDDTEACAKFMRGVSRRIDATRKQRPVVVLRQMVPELDVARDGADAALRALCVICPRRDRCEGRLQ